MKEEPIEKTESEKELDMLWGEMDMLLRAEEIGLQVGNIGTNEASENPASHCKHDTIFNEEIGIYCRWCGWIATEIKYITPPFVDSERSGRKGSNGGANTPQFDGDLFNGSGNDSKAVWSHGTVWDLIPDIRQSLYPHQQEGFEFIWKNLDGSIDLAKIKRVGPPCEGGCIISHAPGTGKTRLTMVFLQTYLQVFPKCLPVIIAPANILLTWEDELRKWNIGIPFHNLNNADLSGKEYAINKIDWSGNQQHNKDTIRMMKLCSWYKEKSILLISYNLYEKLAGGKEHIEKNALGEVLRDKPGLLILDEGHTPRNHRSCIWKVLSESRTQKRILLSGTPFQNNFMELYNILCLMKPSFPDSIPQELKKFCQSRLMHDRQASKDVNWEPATSGNPADEKINQLKMLMTPFVNVHKGSILQKNLPGLRDCVLVLQPDGFQQQMLESIECSQNGLNFEHKLALVSVHPSLFLNCSLSEKEEAVIDKDRLEKLRPKPYGGVKTKFLMEFVKLCDAVDEKVLVFSQFIDTLCLIKEHLESTFNWSVGTEVLYMYGKVDQKQKQSLIHSFNDANSQAKVLLASIKACSEGINLTGASRVVLVDVVWNPSVERQAICRAYRLGQKRVVYTYHLLAQDTPEFTKYCKQAQKDRLSELVFSNKNAESDKVKSCGVEFEDKVLDIMLQHKNLKDMFAECLLQPKDRDLETGPLML
uniref:DNA repair protein rhp54 n=1 Tax=Cajanus cajan TaxID=3821 RepID=A0A151S5C7_CAJCA|nr:DNA repair protein rhp54 [Cajanus cajan]